MFQKNQPPPPGISRTLTALLPTSELTKRTEFIDRGQTLMAKGCDWEWSGDSAVVRRHAGSQTKTELSLNVRWAGCPARITTTPQMLIILLRVTF